MEDLMVLKVGHLFRARSADPLGDQELAGLLEPGIEFEGKMTVPSGMVRINTHLKGEIDCAGVVVLADQGEVEGEIRASFISIAGKVKGTIHAFEKVEIKAHGIVLGDIHTPSLLIEPGGYFDGQCHMPVPESANISEETNEAKQKA
jgi:cytoskeletal protein CcmA (bactofilin family)